MKRLLTFLSLICVYACSDFYSEEEMAITYRHIGVSILDIVDYGERVVIHSYINPGEKLRISQSGHCYEFDSFDMPDTSSFIVQGTKSENSLAVFYSSIDYQRTNTYMKVRGYIVFSDSLIYSPVTIIYLNHNEY